MAQGQAADIEAGSKPAQILEAAGRLFLDGGYGAVSMDAVARTANVSKATLYAHFHSKEALFAAMIRCECRNHRSSLPAEDMARMATADALGVIARRFLALVLSPKALAAYRVVIGEAQRFPELASAFYEAGPASSIAEVAGYLADADRRGRLRVAEPRHAAECFLAMLKSDFHLRLLLGMCEPPGPAELDRHIDRTVALFMAAHAVRD